MEIYFAPLQGYTQMAYRRIHAQIYGGVDYYCSPFIRIEKGEVRSKDIKDIEKCNNEGINLIPQVIASDVSELKKTVDAVYCQGYRHIDVNMGCPFPLQTGKGRGAGLLPKEDEVKNILNAIASYEDISFSLKMRLGLVEVDECIKLLPYINNTPLKYVVIHPRVGRQQYKGCVDMSAFDRFYKECTHPIIYNGDITTIEDIERIKTQYPRLKGIMIGRGLLARPSLAMEYKTGTKLSDEEECKLLLKFHDSLFEHYSSVLQGDAHLLVKMKTFWDYISPETIDKRILKTIKKSTSISKYSAGVSQCRK